MKYPVMYLLQGIGGDETEWQRFAKPNLVLDNLIAEGLWVVCGNKDNLFRISHGVHAYLKEKDVPHVWHADGHAHEPTEWRNNLYLFAQKLFR